MANGFARLLAEHETTISSVHRATNVPTSTLSEWKDGKHTPKVHTVIAVANHFGVSVEDIMRDEADM